LEEKVIASTGGQCPRLAPLLRLPSSIAALVVVLAGCEIGLAPGLAGRPSHVESSRQGCRLNLETQVATCACMTPPDLAELPDRPDLVTLDAELDASSDAGMLARLTHLRALRVSDPSPRQLGGIAALPQVEHLTISTRSPIDFRSLANMHPLRSLAIVAYASEPVPAGVLAPLTDLPALTELTLDGPFPSASELEPMFPRAVVTVRRPANQGPPPSACRHP
jgi:hypothetical protein